MTRTLIVTNDFPPRAGGIQAFVHQLAARQPAESLVVYAPAWKGAETFDAAQPFDVVRHPTSLMLPVPEVARRAADLARGERCDTVWFGAAAPLGLLAPGLRDAGVQRFVAQTHGHEVGWAALPGARALLRRIADGVDVITYLGEYTRRRLARVVGDRAELVRLPPGVDTEEFHPGVDGAAIRAGLGLADRPVVVGVRPEYLSLRGDPAPGAVRGTVAIVENLGVSSLITLECSDGVTLGVTVPEGSEPPIAATVYAVPEPGRLLVYAADTGDLLNVAAVRS